eukprot:3825845-Prymnesium_polylepis.1
MIQLERERPREQTSSVGKWNLRLRRVRKVTALHNVRMVIGVTIYFSIGVSFFMVRGEKECSEEEVARRAAQDAQNASDACYEGWTLVDSLYFCM